MFPAPLLLCIALPQDFNGDGFQDLAVGAPYDDIDDTLFDSGAVSVIYGGPGQPAAPGAQLWTQASARVLGDPAPLEYFGFALSYGDYDGNGFDDLAVGIPSDDLPGAVAAGAVQILYGSAAGLTASGNQLFNQNTPGLGSVAEYADTFGQVLASGDLNGDGFGDLAVGVPYEDEGLYDSGAVQVLYGGPGGLSSAGSQYWTQDSPGVQETAESPDRFGWALAAGDFNHDGIADLVVGAPFESLGGVAAAGALHVLFGSPAGVTAAGNQLWHQDVAGVPGTAQANEYFGAALAAADFNADGFSDLAAGVRSDYVGIQSAGGVNVLYGGPAGLSAAGSQLWNQDSPGLAEAAEGADQFGYALAAGDLDGDGHADLAIGAPNEYRGVQVSVGAVSVLFGGGGGLSAAGSALLRQGQPFVPDRDESYDVFGQALAILDLNGDGVGDLAVGAPGEKLSRRGQGAVTLVFGAGALPPRQLSEATPGVPGDPGISEQFGFSLAR